MKFVSFVDRLGELIGLVIEKLLLCSMHRVYIFPDLLSHIFPLPFALCPLVHERLSFPPSLIWTFLHQYVKLTAKRILTCIFSMNNSGIPFWDRKLKDARPFTLLNKSLLKRKFTNLMMAYHMKYIKP